MNSRKKVYDPQICRNEKNIGQILSKSSRLIMYGIYLSLITNFYNRKYKYSSLFAVFPIDRISTIDWISMSVMTKFHCEKFYQYVSTIKVNAIYLLLDDCMLTWCWYPSVNFIDRVGLNSTSSKTWGYAQLLRCMHTPVRSPSKISWC